MVRCSAIGTRVVLSALIFATGTACGAAADPVPAAIEKVPVATWTPDPIAVRANELGLVPILMYHQVTPSPVGEYDQTPEKFRAELERLYRENYRPVTAGDYICGHIDIPAGTHPVVLTFDDSTITQLRFTEDAEVVPDTAIGILEEFGARNPDFRPTATFYVNNEPFAGDGHALPWLAAHGYEIGAHTASHANLGRLDSIGVQRELVENLRAIVTAAPGNRVRTMALPLGIFPADRVLATAGSWDGTNYAFEAVLLVGAEPAPSPFGQLDPAGVPRIRSGKSEVDFASAYWLDRLDQHPDQRYTSDGNPNKISAPKLLADELNPRWRGQFNPY
ncbi:polysaccharide deacetylase family protein [Nocardia sp. NPDC049737]|uniref:polysaccharide deacetylase family protein n=1 Tax=Nocardia sp. NPDC049737 TaxID=3154358 RepID=UPI003421C008